MYRPVFLLFVFAMLLSLSARANKDSLEKVLPTLKEDTIKVLVMDKIALSYIEVDNDLVVSYANRILSLSRKLKYDIGISEGYNLIGIAADLDAKYAKALDYYDTALVFAKKAGRPKKEANTLNNIGLIYSTIGDYPKAITTYLEALRVFEQAGEKKMQANALSNIGLVYSYMHQHKEALDYQRKALAIREEMGEAYGRASTYNNIAMTLEYLKFHDSAAWYYKKAVDLLEGTKDEYLLATCYQNLGSLSSTLKKYAEAEMYYTKSIAIREKIDDKQGLTFGYVGMGELYAHTRDIPKSIEYGQKALKIAKEIESISRISKACEQLAQTYSLAGDYKQAYEMMLEVYSFQKKIFDRDKNEQAEELAVKYEVEKKDLLIKTNEAELSSKTLKLKQRNTQMIFLAFLLVSTIGIAYLLYNRYKLKQNALLQAAIIKQQDIASKAIIEAEERERNRIGGDLHDGIGQMFSAVKMNLSSLSDHIQFTDGDGASLYDKTIALVDESCKEVRSISHQMMPNVLLKAGLTSAVRDFLNKIDGHKLQINLSATGINERLDTSKEIVLYRVIQEAVNNVIKHANASKLDIQLHKDDEGIHVTVEDNGKGFDTKDALKKDGIGLKNITSRVEFLKGNVEFDAAPNRGTVVSIWIPA